MNETPSTGTPASVLPLTSRYPRATIILLGFGGFVAATFGLWAVQSIAAPVLLALVIVICVNPVRYSLEKRGVPRALATGSVIGVTFALLAAFLGALVIALARFSALLPEYTPQIQQLGADIGALLQRLGVSAGQVQNLVDDLDPSRLIAIATGLLGNISGLLVGFIVVITTVLLMVMDAAYLPAQLKRIAPERPHFVAALTDFASGVRRYMVATTGLGVAQGLLNWVSLLIMGVPGAFLWGLLSFLCSYIPNVGYFIAIVPPLVFGLLAGGWPTVIGVIIVYAIINAVVQSVIQPRVVGGAVSLSQTLTLISVLFRALVLGPLGAILAIPLTLLVRTVLVDADPKAGWWRPLTGDIDEARQDMRNEDEATRAEHKARRASRRSPAEHAPASPVEP